MILKKSDDGDKQPPDSVNISEEAREKEVLSRISNNIISQINENDYKHK
jgi:hypothetical protein